MRVFLATLDTLSSQFSQPTWREMGLNLAGRVDNKPAESRKALAEEVRDKHLLGYHDIRVGNNPESVLNGTPGKLVASHTCAMNMEAL